MQVGEGETRATAVANCFDIGNAATKVEPYGDGLINATFLVIAEDKRFILQRINDLVFPEPERIMSNLSLLQGHLSTQAESGLRIPVLIPARDGSLFVRDELGGIWRMMDLIPNARTLKRFENLEQAREVGRILGRFHVLVAEFPQDRLAETLPGFHVTPSYVERFEQVLAEGTGTHPDDIDQIVAFTRSRQAGAGVLEEAKRQERIPKRVVHGDPKLDNILFDSEANRAISLIDLDTVQPGLAHYDIGDCLRSCCNRRVDSTEAVARFDLDVCQAILGAYAEQTNGLLSSAEIELLFDAIRLIPFELGLRFVTDHLEGDRYFRVTERGQNLHKAWAQFALVEDIEAKESEIRRIVADCFSA